MKKKILVLSLCALLVAGCASLSSVLTAVSNWLPVAVSVFDGVVAIAAPANSSLALDAKNIQVDFADLESAVAAARAAGSGVTGAEKVVAELQAVSASIPKIVTDLKASGVPISANDQAYIAASDALLLATAEAFEAQLASQIPAPVKTAKLVDVKGDCFGFKGNGDGSYSAWAHCDMSDPIDYDIPAPTAKGASKVAAPKAPKLGSFKRQYNALCKRYGHSEKQVPLSMLEKAHVK